MDVEFSFPNCGKIETNGLQEEFHPSGSSNFAEVVVVLAVPLADVVELAGVVVVVFVDLILFELIAAVLFELIATALFVDFADFADFANRSGFQLVHFDGRCINRRPNQFKRFDSIRNLLLRFESRNFCKDTTQKFLNMK